MKKRKKLLLTITLLTLSLTTFGQTARVNIYLINSPYLILERYSFFEQPKEIKVEKIGEHEFSLTYFGKEPKLYNLNFKDILISPGDSVELIYNKINSDPDFPKDIISANGKNSSNYTFSNHELIQMPRQYYPVYNQGAHKNNAQLIFNILQKNNKLFTDSIAAILLKNNCDEGLIDFVRRRTRLNLYYNLDYLQNNLGKIVGQNELINRLKDSLMMKTNFVAADTNYNYFSELLIKNYYAHLLANKYNNLRSENDYRALIDFIDSFPNNFVKNYLVYFLSIDNDSMPTKYHYAKAGKLINTNIYFGRVMKKVLDRNNVYK